jgi:hypothetical protein
MSNPTLAPEIRACIYREIAEPTKKNNTKPATTNMIKSIPLIDIYSPFLVVMCDLDCSD